MADKAKAKKEESPPLTSGEVVARSNLRTMNEWRAAQGLPPIDMSKETRTKDDPK